MSQLDGLGVFPLDVLGEVDQRRFGVGEAADDVLDLEVGARARLFEPEGSPHAAEPADDLQATITEWSDEDRVELPGGALLAVTLTLLGHHVPSQVHQGLVNGRFLAVAAEVLPPVHDQAVGSTRKMSDRVTLWSPVSAVNAISCLLS